MDGKKEEPEAQENSDYREEGASPGDVIYVDRFPKPYKHFGIYLGHNRVIHFAPPKGGSSFCSGEDATIHEANMAEFMDGQTEYTVCIFGHEYGEVTEQEESWTPSVGILGSSFGSLIILSMIRKFLRSSDYHLYSPKETIERARSQIGKHDYNLVFNNCEHFALWCKTGIHESKQIDQLLDVILTRSILFPPDSFLHRRVVCEKK